MVDLVGAVAGVIAQLVSALDAIEKLVGWLFREHLKARQHRMRAYTRLARVTSVGDREPLRGQAVASHSSKVGPASLAPALGSAAPSA